MKTVCFTHNDLDGKCAGAIAKYFNPKTYVIECNYGTPLEIDKVEKELIICDFTPETKEDFEALINKIGIDNIVWLDHHYKNYIKYPEYEGIKGIRVNTNPSGAMLTWQYYYPEKEAPMFVKLVSDYDTWTYEYGDKTRWFIAGMKIFRTASNSDLWIELIENENKLEEVLEKGKIIHSYIQQENAASARRSSFEIEFEGYKTIVCNVSRQNSTFFDSVIKDHDIMMTFNINKDMVYFSIYTTKEIDLSSIASKYGGGGHPKASGFYLPLSELEFILKKGTCERF